MGQPPKPLGNDGFYHNLHNMLNQANYRDLSYNVRLYSTFENLAFYPNFALLGGSHQSKLEVATGGGFEGLTSPIGFSAPQLFTVDPAIR